MQIFMGIKKYLDNVSVMLCLLQCSCNIRRKDNCNISFELDGYEANYINRRNKSAESVALYVGKNLNYKVVKKIFIDNLLECIFIEISKSNRKNNCISCVYRALGSDMHAFLNWFRGTYSTLQKTIFVCVDFKIDLLNPNTLNQIDEFINTVYSLSPYPTSTILTRINPHCATLIENTFTNNIEHKMISGLLVNDIRDHLPIFIVCDNNYRNSNLENSIWFKWKRTADTINALKNELIRQTWEEVYQEIDVDMAYEIFVRIFASLYDKNGPLSEVSN